MAGLTTKGAAYLAIASICGVTAVPAAAKGVEFGVELIRGGKTVTGQVSDAPTTDAPTGTTIPK